MTSGGQVEAAGGATRVIVGIATTGRPDIVRETVLHMSRLTDQPDGVILSVANVDDVDQSAISTLPFTFDVIQSPKGACDQRNAIFDRVPADAVLLFLDDDFLISDGFITATRSAFEQEADVVMATGTVLADGILGPGMDHPEGLTHLAKADPLAHGAARSEIYNGYGCNMAVRMATIHKHNLRFDIDLPLYSWLEDVDLSRRLVLYGRLIKDSNMQGVHLGTKTGRSPGMRLGYSQIANPIYLIRKGTMAPTRATRLILRNVAANLAKSFRPEPWVDRSGRVRGNLMAVRDLITGRISPKRILEM